MVGSKFSNCMRGEVDMGCMGAHKSKIEDFISFHNISLETFVPNLVSLTCTSLRYWANADGGISDFWISGQFLINENCDSSRTSNGIDMKLGPVTKLDKRNTKTQKDL